MKEKSGYSKGYPKKFKIKITMINLNMKNVSKAICIGFVLLLASTTGFAQIEKSKTIDKTFDKKSHVKIAWKASPLFLESIAALPCPFTIFKTGAFNTSSGD